MHKFIKLSFLFIILLFLFSTYSQSETDKPTRENINIDSDLFKTLKKNPTKSTKRWFQPQDFNFLIPLAILFYAVISGMRSTESAEKKNKLRESKEKPKHEVYFNIQMSDLSGNHKCTSCGSFYHTNPAKEPRITFVQAGGLADESLEIDDLICKINGG